jgi:hypothetical protein
MIIVFEILNELEFQAYETGNIFILVEPDLIYQFLTIFKLNIDDHPLPDYI